MNQAFDRTEKFKARVGSWLRSSTLAGMALVLFAGMFSATSPLEAATGDVVFNGTISSVGLCTITIRYNGTLGVSTNLRQLSSRIAGGAEASADVWMSGRNRVSVDTPSIFAVAPNDGDTGVTRSTTWRGNILPAGSSWPDRTTPLGFIGTGNIRTYINYVANRPTAFPGGHYEAISVIRCEAY